MGTRVGPPAGPNLFGRNRAADGRRFIAHTLALWMMFTMAVPTFVSTSPFAVESSHNPTALFVVSALSLAANLAVAAYQVFVIVTRHRNPLRDELYTYLPQYREVREANLPAGSALPETADRRVTV